MDINCPYCDAELEINHDDGVGYEQNVRHEMECDECEKSFVFTTEVSFSYEVEKADCLNDGKHDFKLIATAPKAFSKMGCQCCDERRELTEKERVDFGIETKENYFEQLK